MEKLLEKFKKRLHKGNSSRFVSDPGWQPSICRCGLILLLTGHCKRPVCADGGRQMPRTSLRAESCKSGSRVFATRITFLQNTHPQPVPHSCLVFFSRAHTQEQHFGGAEGRDRAPWALLPCAQVSAAPPATSRASFSLFISWCADTDHRGVLWVLIN